MSDVGWGVLGAGWLVTQATAAAIHNADGARLVAAGARDLDRAASIQPDRAYDDYDAMIADPNVEAVYIALANDAHLPWIRAALQAGKHVLCEKPMVLTAAEAERAFADARDAGVMLVEAAWSRWHPRIQRVVELARSGAIGDMTSLLGTFTFSNVPEGNYRLSRARGGGALFDVGIYPLHVLIACLPTTEKLDVSHAQMLMSSPAVSDDAVDLTTKAVLGWGTEGRATVMASFEMPESQRLEVRGSQTTLRIDDDQAFTTWCQPSRLLVGEHTEVFPAVDAYQIMIEQMSARIRTGSGWVLPPADSIRVAHAVDAIQSTAEHVRSDESA